MNGVPEIRGYQFDQRLLAHPLAEIWRGRGFAGMEVIALVLSEAGAADPEIRGRLEQAGRTAALDPAQQQTPLWAANLSAARPYAITQLVPGESGAERLLDPLDGILGNDAASLDAVRAQLAQYGAAPPALGGPAVDLPSYTSGSPVTGTSPTSPITPGTSHNPASTRHSPTGTGYGATPPSEPGGAGSGDADAQRRAGVGGKLDLLQEKLGGYVYLVIAVVALIVFTVTYSVGAAIGSTTKDRQAAAPAAAPAASPSPYPTPAVKPGIPQPRPLRYREPDGAPGLVGAVYPPGADVQLVSFGLPITFGWPRLPVLVDLGETTTMVYRRVLLDESPQRSGLDAKLALQPCANLTACQTARRAFDQEWSTKYRVAAPTTARAANTWLTQQTSPPYSLMMTRIFAANGRWWLLGVAITARSGEEPTAQQVLNDIYRQTT